MATTMEGAVTVPADKDLVWAKLNDPDVLKACISGCDRVEKKSETRFIATATVKVGPLRTTVKGKLDLQNFDPPNGCRLVGEGEGGFAGFAQGVAEIRLFSVPEGTMVTYAVEASVGGRLAHLGARFIDGVAKRMADAFFGRFVAALAPSTTAA